jgi:translation initiation factor 1
MEKKDWKDLLGGLGSSIEETSSTDIPEKDIQIIRQDLIIRFEKRNGKPATIVSNFQGTECELKDLARKLKTHLGTGGSAKDDEILIQGDVRQKVAVYLRNSGYKVRGNI